MTRPVMLTILDGFGWREETADNAVALANKPVFDRLWRSCPHAFLKPSGKAVGLPDGQMGNSEVGHLNIGAGRVVMQELPRIDHAIEQGDLEKNAALARFVAAMKDSGGTAHLFGLISPGGVHSHQNHVAALARLLATQGVEVVVHVITDGRDTTPEGGAGFVRNLAEALPEGARLGTVIGRYYAMDRDKRWERTKLAYDLMVDGEGTRADDPIKAIEASYGDEVTDEFIKPIAIGDYRGMKNGDGVVCANFRADRVRQILTALLDPEFDGFKPARRIDFASALGMASYSDALDHFLSCLFPPERMEHLLGEVAAEAGLKQLRAAETEKYPHVTYFLNGGRENPFEGEDRILVPSPKVATYDLQPEMSAPELTERVAEAIESGKYDLIVLNYANPDMVGHTGSLKAAIAAVETVDRGLGRLIEAIEKQGGAMIITADHGNCELMKDPETGGPHTAHTLNKVPVVLFGGPEGARLHDGILADLAPSLLDLLGIGKPSEMTGSSLIERKE